MANLARLPPLNSLRAFVVVARHLSFSRAAEELLVTAAAVSQQIKQLEAFVGRPLFRRQHSGLQLTDAGQACLQPLADAFDSMVAALALLPTAGLDGPLTVSVAPSFASKWLVPRLETFKARHPDIDVRVAASMELASFENGEVDCAIRYGAGNYNGFSVDLLLTESVFPVCSPALLRGEHPLDHAAALRHHVLLHDDSPDQDPSCPDWRMWLRAAGIGDLNPAQGPRFNQSSLVLDAAAAGQGVALAKAQLASEDLRTGRLIRPFGGEQRVDFGYYFVRPADKQNLPKVQAFRAWLHATAE
jgi:LysR family glycine cleavage system transcriptional activator